MKRKRKKRMKRKPYKIRITPTGCGGFCASRTPRGLKKLPFSGVYVDKVTGKKYAKVKRRYMLVK